MVDNPGVWFGKVGCETEEKFDTPPAAETETGMKEAQDKLLKSYQGQDLFVPEGSVSAITTSIASTKSSGCGLGSSEV